MSIIMLEKALVCLWGHSSVVQIPTTTDKQKGLCAISIHSLFWTTNTSQTDPCCRFLHLLRLPGLTQRAWAFAPALLPSSFFNFWDYDIISSSPSPLSLLQILPYPCLSMPPLSFKFMDSFFPINYCYTHIHTLKYLITNCSVCMLLVCLFFGADNLVLDNQLVCDFFSDLSLPLSQACLIALLSGSRPQTSLLMSHALHLRALWSPMEILTDCIMSHRFFHSSLFIGFVALIFFPKKRSFLCTKQDVCIA